VVITETNDLHKKRKTRQRQLADGSDPIYKECSFFARRAQRAGRFPQSNQRGIQTGFDLLPSGALRAISKGVVIVGWI
jgi:hypothetical protein